MKKYNIAITGANGYIGGHLVKHFNNSHNTIYRMVRNPSMSSEKVLDAPYYLGQSSSLEYLGNVDVLIHCAYDFSVKSLSDIRKVNVEGSRVLFDAARAQGVKKIIYLSTTSSFEGATSNYGKTKLELELVAKDYCATIVRPGLVFSRNPGGIVGAVDRLTDKSRVVPIIGKGDQLFYPCHVDDLANLIEYLIEHPITHLPIVAACEQSISFKNMIITLAQSHKKKVILLPVPYYMVYLGLKLIEVVGLKFGMRSDSLKYFKTANNQHDFNLTNSTGIKFRPFSTQWL